MVDKNIIKYYVSIETQFNLNTGCVLNTLKRIFCYTAIFLNFKVVRQFFGIVHMLLVMKILSYQNLTEASTKKTSNLFLELVIITHVAKVARCECVPNAKINNEI